MVGSRPLPPRMPRKTRLLVSLLPLLKRYATTNFLLEDKEVDKLADKIGELGADSPASNLLKSTYDVTVSTLHKISSSTNQSSQLKVTLADQQADPNSPLYSIKKFEDLGL